ncbi:MAG: branched-chain amino acid ABC transporter permease [Elainellaceae cyanobacterium]
MEGYIVSLIIFTAVFALFSLGLNLQWGFTGLINFGHVAFMVVGSYLVVMLTLPGYLKAMPERMVAEIGWIGESPQLSSWLLQVQAVLPGQIPLWLAILIGAGAAAVLGLLMGIATLKLREDYLAIVTIGVAEIIRLVALNEEWLTRGSFGIQQFPLPLADLNPNLGIRIAMIAVLTGIVGLGVWYLWRWARRRIKSASAGPLLISSGAIALYIALLVPLLLAISTFCRWLSAIAAPPDWMLALVLLVLLLGGGGLYGWAGHRLLPRLPAQPEGTALLAAVVISGLGLWVYGYAASALYHYERNAVKTGLMWLSVIVLALVFAGLQRLVRSPWGRVLKAIREDEEVARALGKNVFWYKLQSLMLGGAIAGIAGALYAWQLTTVYPDNFRPLETFNAWTIVVLGGAGSNVGTLLGAAIFWAYQTLTRFFLEDLIPLGDAQLGAFRIMLIGLLLMVLMIWRPQGLLGKAEELTLGR